MSNQIKIAATGAFGGIFPIITQLAIDLTGRTQVSQVINYIDVAYIFGIALFAAIGAAVAIIFRETDLIKVFYIGIGLPSLIQANASNISSHKTSPDNNQTTNFFMSSAFAEESPSISLERKLLIKPHCISYDVIFLSSDEKKVEKITIDPKTKTTISIPDFAAYIQVEKLDSVSEKQPITSTAQANILLDVEAKKDFWSGFYRAIGVKNTNSYNVNINQTNENKAASESEKANWAIIFGSDPDFLSAFDEVNKTKNTELSDKTYIYLKSSRFRSVIVLGDLELAKNSLQFACELSYNKDAYLVNLSTWCPSSTIVTDNNGKYFKCED